MVALPLPQVTFPGLSFVFPFQYFFLSFLFFPQDPDSVLLHLSLCSTLFSTQDLHRATIRPQIPDTWLEAGASSRVPSQPPY